MRPKHFFLCVVLVLWLNLFNCSLIKGSFSIVTHNLTVRCDQHYFNHSVLLHTEQLPNTVDAFGWVVRDIDELLYLRTAVHSVLAGGRLQPWITSRPTELCAFFAKARRQMLLRGFFELANSLGNRMNRCPVRAMQFQMIGLELSPKLLPSFAPAGKYLARLDILRQPQEAGKFVMASSVSWFGEIVRQ